MVTLLALLELGVTVRTGDRPSRAFVLVLFEFSLAKHFMTTPSLLIGVDTMISLDTASTTDDVIGPVPLQHSLPAVALSPIHFDKALCILVVLANVSPSTFLLGV